MTPHFTVHREPGPFEPGEAIAGTVVVDEPGHVELFELEARYWERTTAGFEALASRVRSGPLFSGVVEAGAAADFSLPLPADALPAYRSTRAELGWRLEAHLRIDGADEWEVLAPLEVGRPSVAEGDEAPPAADAAS